MISLILAVGLLAADNPNSTADKKAADPNAVVCRHEKRPGSRATLRVCLTAREWEERDRQGKDLLDAAVERREQTRRP